MQIENFCMICYMKKSVEVNLMECDPVFFKKDVY